MRALILILASLALTSANALNIKKAVTPPEGSPGKVKLIITPGEDITLGKLDILFVVDDSGSMSSHQQTLSKAVPDLVKKLKNFTSVHAAVISSDMDDSSRSGKFIVYPSGSPAVLDNTMSNFEEVLKKRMIVGTNGSGTEQFFAPVMAALSSPLIDKENKDFLRADAQLAIVMVTDTDDQSPNITPEQFVIAMATLKADKYAIINFVADPAVRGCSSQIQTLPERLGLARYMANGTEHNICDGKFAEGVEDVANKVQKELNSKIALPSKPDVSTIKVTYGTMTFPANDSVNGWTYVESDNSLQLGSAIDFNKLQSADLIIEYTVR